MKQEVLSKRLYDGLLADMPPELAATVGARVERYAGDALQALTALYGEHPAFSACLERVAGMVRRASIERPEALGELDRRRESEAPDWFQQPDMLGYSAYVDRFAGTLGGVADKIGYLKELGVTYLHLLPLLTARPGDNDGGFAVADYRQVMPELGDNDDLVRLAAQLRQNGISLCLDLVSNHTAREHAWARAAAAGDPVYQDYYLFFPNRDLPDRYEDHLLQVFPDSAPGNFTYVEEADAWVWTTFYPFQWDLNYANPAVFCEILDIMLFLANLGVEVFRIDAAAYMWKRLGTSCRGLPETHRLLQAWRALMAIAAPAVALKAEAIVRARDIGRYLGADGRECHLAYHNALMAGLWDALAVGDAWRMTALLASMPAIPRGTAWLTYIRCHDDIGWDVLQDDQGAAWSAGAQHLRFLAEFYAGRRPGSFARGKRFERAAGKLFVGTNGTLASLAGLEKALETGQPADVERALRRILLLYSVLFAFGGIPLIAMGDELGLTNDYNYARSGKSDDGRWLHRVFMDWDKAGRRRVDGALEARLFAALQGLIRVRATLDVLHAGVPTRIVPAGDDHLFAFLRDAPQPLLFLGNFGDQPHEARASALAAIGFDRDLEDRLTGQSCTGRRAITLAPYETRWLMWA